MQLPLYFFVVLSTISIMLLLNSFIKSWPVIPLLSSITSAKNQPSLRLNSNHEFRIAIFSDVHYGEEENGWGIDQDVGSTRVMKSVLDYEDPDFVIVSKCFTS